MDYHSLKRRELQALCKEHNIPANSANSVLADKLSALLNEKQKPITRQRTCMRTPIEGTVEGEPAALKRQSKKVRFSPSNDLVEYELRSGEKQDMVTRIKARRKSVAKKVDKPVVDNNTTVELVVDSSQIPVKLTRSRVQLPGKDVVIPNNEKKQTRREAKVFEKRTDEDKETEGNVREVTRSKAHTLKRGCGVQREESRQSKRLIEDVEKAGESVEGTVVSRARVTRSKAKTLMEGGSGPDVNPYVRKKSGKQVEADGQYVAPSKEIMDIPMRATRSRRQTLKQDIGNAVTNLRVDKKRTRREMKATDLSINSNHVAPVDKKSPPKRKSLRTRGVEAVDEDEDDKGGVVNDGRVTSSKAPLAMEVSGRNSRNKANKVGIQQLEEPSKHASKKNVNRRKSVLRPEKTEVIIHLEEPVNRPARKNTRRNSIMQKATKMVESPTVGKKQSKGQFGKLSMIKGLEDKESVTRSGKDASEDEFKEASTGSPKSRKRRGTPIIDDQTIETEYGSLVDKSPKSSTHSDRKSDGKSVAKMQAESGLKKSMSRMTNQSSVENSSKGKSLAIRSGAILRDGSSKKRAKLSGTKQSDSEDHDVNSTKEVTPVLKMGNFKLDDEVTQPEVTPAIEKFDRRFTRSTIRSERKEQGQSAIKEQPIAGTQLSSVKVAKFRPDPAVNTAPGRITRRGIKHGGNAAGSFSEKVGKKKQASQSAQKKQFLDDAQKASPEVAEVVPNAEGVSSEIEQPLDEAQMFSPEVAEVGPNPDVDTIGVRPEYKQPYDTPVAKMGNFKLDDEVTQPEVTPAVDKFDGRFTRSAIRSERKEPAQSAIKEQPIAGTQLSSAKVAKFRSDPTVNTAPGRITRRGIKHGGNAAGSFSEKVGKKKQASQSAQKKQFLDDAQKASPEVAEVVPNAEGVSSEIEQPLDEAQMFSPEVAEVGPNPDVDTIGVRPEYKQPYDTPVAKMGNFKLDDEVTQPEVTPAVDKFDGRFTRSAIRSERKEPAQSAIKEQPIAGTQLSSAKVAKFRPDPTVNTAPGRITCRGNNAAGSFSEKVGKKKQTSQSAHKKQSLDDAQKASPEVAEVVPNPEGVSSEIEQSLDEAQMFSPEVAEVGPNPDVNTIGVRPEYKQPYDDVQMSSPEVAEVLANPDSYTVRVGSETSREVTGQMLGDLSASESVSLPTIVVENRDTVSGTSVDTYSASLVSGENASGEVMEDAGATPCLTKNLLSGKQQNPSELQSFDDGTPSGKFSRIRMTSVSMADVAETVPDAVSDGSHVQNRNEEVYVESGIFSEAVNLETSVLESGRPDAKEKETESTESGSTSKGLQTDVMIEEPLVSVGKSVVLEERVDISSLGISTKGNNVDDDHNCDSISYDVGSPAVCHASIQQSDVADDGEQYDEDESANDQKPLMSEPVSENRGVADGVEAQEMDSLALDYDDVPNIDDTLCQLTVNNMVQGHDMEDADDTGKHPAKELEFEVVPSTHNNIHDIPILGKSDGEDGSFNAAKESETDSMPSCACNMIQDPLLSGNDCEDESDTTNKEHESNPKPLPDIDAYDASPMGNDVYGECDNATISDRKSRLDMFGTPLVDKGYVLDDGDNAPKELETGSELSNANNLEDDNNAQDGESGHDQLTSNDNLATDEEDLGGDDLEPPQNKSMPVVTEVLVRSCDQEPEQMLNVAVDDVLCDTVGESASVTDKDTPKTPATCGNDDMVVRVDALEESVLDINKDVVSSILGDIYDMDADYDRGNEKGSTESDEGFQPKEIRGFSSITRESLPITYKKEESPVDDTDSDLPTVKEDDKNKQEETLNAGTSVDLGGYDFGMDEFENPADRSVDMMGKGKKDDQDSDIHTSVRTSSSIEETSGLEAGLSNSVRNLEENSQNVADGKSNQEVDMLKESAKTTDVTQEVFNWSDSSLKSLFATPVATRVSCVKDSQEDAVNLANQDTYSSRKPFVKTPAVPQSSHVSAVRGPENEMYGVPSFEDYPLKLFGDEEVGGSFDRSGRNRHFEFKGDQDDEIKQFEFLSEAAGTSHLDPSGLKDNPIRSGEFEKKEETLMEGSKTDDGLAFGTGK